MFLCPKCKDCYLNQAFVDVGFRKEEEHGLVTEVTTVIVITSIQESSNSAFSHRKDRVTIHF